MRATAGTDVVVDVLVFQRRTESQAPNDTRWMNLMEIELDRNASRVPEEEVGSLSDSYSVEGASDKQEPSDAGQRPFAPISVLDDDILFAPAI